MSLYVDSSAFLAVLVDEPTGPLARAVMLADPDWFSARHTLVEVRRNLARLVAPADLAEARSAFERDWARTNIIELDEMTCEEAAGIAEETGSRSLDALHLASARRLAGSDMVFLTLDRRQAAAARMVGLSVSGADAPATASADGDPDAAG